MNAVLPLRAVQRLAVKLGSQALTARQTSVAIVCRMGWTLLGLFLGKQRSHNDCTNSCLMDAPQIFRVLLVEDSEVDAVLAQAELSREPQFVVAHVERLEEAISELKNVHTDAVVLDLGLPDSDGVETLTKLRQDAPHVPVIVLTSTSGEQCELQSAREGAEGYLVKGRTVEGQLRRAVRFTVEREGFNATDARLAADSIVAGGKDKVGEIAHTLNNLLTVMIGQTELVVSKLRKDSPVREDLGEVLLAAERATQLTDQLLHLRRA